MFEVKAKWIGGWKFEGKDGEGHVCRMDWSKSVGGEGDGFRPAELPLWGLAGCTGSDTHISTVSSNPTEPRKTMSKSWGKTMVKLS